MKSLLHLLLVASLTSAHFFFPTLIINGHESKEWQYTRDVADKMWPQLRPQHPPQSGKQYPIAPTSPDSICGYRENVTHIPETLVVTPSDELQFRIDRVSDGWEEKGYRETYIYHGGPVSVWRSRAPGDDIDGYPGDGQWFKIHEITGHDQTWNYGDGFYADHADALARGKTVPFTIPAITPPGKYLVRVEVNAAGFYQTFANCAQMEVRGPGGGVPGPLFKLPYEYEYFMAFFMDMKYNPMLNGAVPENISTWVAPGPRVWRG